MVLHLSLKPLCQFFATLGYADKCGTTMTTNDLLERLLEGGQRELLLEEGLGPACYYSSQEQLRNLVKKIDGLILERYMLMAWYIIMVLHSVHEASHEYVMPWFLSCNLPGDV